MHYARVEKSIVLPDFQRNYDWDSGDQAEMLRTVIATWPSGSILLMGIRASELPFEVRPLEGAPPHNTKKLRYAVLDGQQRLTSVYQACTGVADETYYVDMHRVRAITGFDDECLGFKRRDQFEQEFGSRNERAKMGIVKHEELY